MSTPILKVIFSDFNHWCCERCARLSNRPEKTRTHLVSRDTACCICGEKVRKGHLIREHPKSPTLKHCKGVHP